MRRTATPWPCSFRHQFYRYFWQVWSVRFSGTIIRGDGDFKFNFVIFFYKIEWGSINCLKTLSYLEIKFFWLQHFLLSISLPFTIFSCQYPVPVLLHQPSAISNYLQISKPVTTLLSRPLHSSTLYCTLLHCTELLYTAPYCSGLHCTVLHCIVM